MSSQWLGMRIQEEKDRRQRETRTQERLPDALEQVYGELRQCIANYTNAFGEQSAGIELDGATIRVTASEEEQGDWQVRNTVQVTLLPQLPGFQIERAGVEAKSVSIGLLPGDKLFYRDQDEYITLEEFSRRILDRVLFPKLAE
jgi:hypothetical protein